MPTTITTKKAVEGSTFILTASFFDEDEVEVTPNAGMVWTLTNGRGVVVNNREDVDVVEDTSVDIVLQGDDLMIEDGRYRILTLEGTYNSDLGSNLPLKDQVIFEIHNLQIV